MQEPGERGWAVVEVPQSAPYHEPNELQCAELPDGTVVLNVRSGNTERRLLTSSATGGRTWSPLVVSEALGAQPICQGSMISVGGVLFYSHGYGGIRQGR